MTEKKFIVKEKFVTSTYDGTKQPYMLFVPTKDYGQRPRPLMVVLHGYGVDHHAWFDMTPVVSIASQYGFVLAAPYGRGNWFYHQPAEQDVLDIIAQIRKEYSIDPHYISLAGHSMGGWGANWIGLRHPELFNVIVPMSGWAPMELLPNALNLAPFYIHDQDDPCVSVENSRKAVSTLASMGLSVRYREETGYGHESKMIGDNLRRIFRWSIEHPKVTCPSRINLATRAPWTLNAFAWLKLLSSANFPDVAIINAKVDKESATLYITTKNVAQFTVNVDTLPFMGKTETMPVICDGVSLTLKKEKAGWAIFKSGSTKEWSVDRFSKSEPKARRLKCHLPAVLAHLKTPGASPKTTGAVATILSPVLKKNADVLILREADYLIPPGGLDSPEKLLEIAIHPDNDLVCFELDGKTLAQRLHDNSGEALHLYPIAQKIDIKKLYRVMTTSRLSYLFEGVGKVESVGNSISQYLTEYGWDK